MDGVPYPQPLAGPEPQYVPWGVLLVRPIGHPPRPVPPRAADQRSRAYPTLLRVLRWGRYGHRGGPQTPEVGSLAGAPRGPFSSRPPFRCAVCGGWCPVSPGWGGGGGGGGCSLFLAVLLAGVSPPPLVAVRRRCVCLWRGACARGVCVGVWCVVCGVWCAVVVCWWGCGGCVVWLVPRHSWRRFLCATPRHSWLGFAACGVVRLPATPGWGSAAGSGVWCVVCGVWCVVSGGGVLVGLWLVCGAVGPSPLLAEVPVCYSPPLLAGFRCLWWCAVPRHSWLGPAGGGGAWRVVCGVWCVVCGGGVLVGLWLWLVPRHSWWRFLCSTPRHSWLGFDAGGGGRSSPLLAEGPGRGFPPLLAGVRWRRWCVVGLWLVCGVFGPSPLLAEVPVCYSPPLLAGFRCRWWCAVPRHSWLGPAGGGGAWRVVCGVWCVVCGGGVWWVCGWCGWSLATPGGGSCVLLPATPGWVSMPVAVGGPRHSWLRALGAVPRHSWLGFPGGGGVWWGCGWCVVWLVPRHPWRSFLCATPRHSWLGFAAGGGVRFPASPGWGLLAVVVRGVWCVVCGGGVLAGLWVVCGVVGPSPLLAEVPVCYSPPLLAGFRCRWWWAVPATPGWGPLAAVVCGVWRWCVGCWSLATPGGGSCVLLPATPGWVSLPVVVGGPRHSWLGSAGGGGVWCVAVVCWLLVPRHSWRRFLCATPRHSWLGFGAGGGGRSSPLLAEGPGRGSPPLLAGFRCRRWCVVCGVWCAACGVRRWRVWWVCGWCGWSLATPGGGSCVLLPATPGWVSLPVVVWCGVAVGVSSGCPSPWPWCVCVRCVALRVGVGGVGGGGVALGVAVVRARACARGVWLVGWGVSYLGWFSSSVVGMFQKAEEEVL